MWSNIVKQVNRSLALNGPSWLHLFAVALGFMFVVVLSASAAATSGINERLNYQARLLDSTGAVVADGTYNLEFKIYQDGAGCESGGSSPCGGTLKWTETRTGSNKVTVTNGYFSVQLGAVTAFGSSVDWNQDTLWLSLNVGGTGSPSWDGEMLPFRRLAATPYALNSKQLGGLDWSKFVQMAPSAVQVDSSTLSSLFLNKTGSSGNILQLQKNGADVAVIGNDGLVTLGGGLTKDITSPNAATATALTIQPGTSSGASSNGPALILKGGDGSGTSTVIGGTLTLQAGSATGGSGSRTGGDVGIEAGSGATANGAINIGITTSSAITIGRTSGGGSTTIQSGSGNITLQASGTSTIGRIQIGAGGAGNSTPDFLALDVKSDTGDPAGGTEGYMYYNTADNKFRCYQGAAWTDCISAGGSMDLQTAYANSTNPATITTADGKNIVFSLSDTSTDANFLIDLTCDTSCSTNGRFAVQGDGVDIMTISPTGAFSYQLPASTTTAFQLLNSGSVPLFVIDTTNSRAYVGNPAADNTGALLVLDSKNTTGDPTGTLGAMYYNSVNDKFRCYEASVWWDCLGNSGERGRRRPFYSNDFLDRSNVAAVAPWISAAVSSGTTSAQSGTASHPGRVRVTSSTTANSGFRFQSDVAAFLVGGGETAEFVFNIQTLTNGTFRMGFLDTTTSTDVTDGVYIEVPSTGAAVCKTANNNTRTTSATIATLSTATWYRAKISVNSAATSATCEIFNDSGTSQGSQINSANMPTAAGRETGHGFIATNSGTTATALMDIDYMSLWWDSRVLTR